jgi:hypothetical protein
MSLVERISGRLLSDRRQTAQPWCCQINEIKPTLTDYAGHSAIRALVKRAYEDQVLDFWK